ncbi:1-deoxy-D-xylulose 5-phosphate reductoisomerase [Litchfieldella qijiaojingensis]|uniref:1-deoxy-D-xylulose 5-phosphate reductoisomerase n=1 Tax=Litchfieldella qijiaojingensis TaxID=980347 RepID=A0ABQ2YY25_9GAMM|nr:1-deoxy-D-xylulose-5-phosphate reductoisomerase [Halomonas qijiaojingensis]GGX97531.1 1-deoxy-D-xylulose 5-phosphate reductoisomerase [Halomonas qijiaojingensis]
MGDARIDMTGASNRPQAVTVLGATGSIGTSTLDVLARHPERYRVHALTAATRREALLDQCLRHRPRVAVLSHERDAVWLRGELRGAGLDTEVKSGETALVEVAEASDAEVVMAAIVGAAGLLPTLAAVRAGKRVLLANKEALVMSGALFMDAVDRHGAVLLPIDSEHNAIYQCLPPEHRGGLARVGVTQLLLTASGGPFLGWQAGDLAMVTPEQACAHPNWSMGRKISVDSATLMNKGLELIEACWLFDARPDQVKVVVHPQSVIHSMVAYSDGSVIAQLGNPDMRTPIAYGLAWPERIEAGVEVLDLFQVARLDFQAPDEEAFPCLRLAREAMDAGGAAPAVLNAANEVAVEAFLAGRLSFTGIAEVVEGVLDASPLQAATELEAILEEDRRARERAERYLERYR